MPGELEVIYGSAERSARLDSRGLVDHDVVAEFEDAQPDLDEPPFDHVLGRWRILVPVESLHSFVLRETKCLRLDLRAPRSSGLPGARESHRQEQRWLAHHHPYPSERLIIADVRSSADRAALGTGHDRAVVPARRRAHADACAW